MKKLFEVFLKGAAFFIIWAVGISVLFPGDQIENPAVWRFFAELIPLLVIIITTFIFVLIEKRRIQIPFRKQPAFNIGLGFLTGLAWIGMSAGILYLTGTLKIMGMNRIPYLGLWIASVFLNALMQELLVRGYLYQLIKKKYQTLAAAVITTVLFTALHGGALEAGIIPVCNVVTMSLFMTVVLEYTQSLLAPVLIHFIWNAAGAVILNGVVLAQDYPHLLNTEFAGNQLLSGGVNQIEGSIIVLVLNILFTILFFTFIIKKGKSVASGGKDSI